MFPGVAIAIIFSIDASSVHGIFSLLHLRGLVTRRITQTILRLIVAESSCLPEIQENRMSLEQAKSSALWGFFETKECYLFAGSHEEASILETLRVLA